MKLPAFLYASRYGVYYLRVLISKKLRQKFTDIPKEIKASLGTTNKREALTAGCALYADFQDFLLEADLMTKFKWEGEEVDPSEWFARTVQQLKAEKELKKVRGKQTLQKYFDEAVSNLLTDEEKKAGLLNGVTHQTEIRELKGKHNISDVIQAYIDKKKAEGKWRDKTESAVIARFNIFKQIMGNRYFDAIGFSEMNFYQRCILKLPINLNCEKRFKGKTITEIIEMKDLDLLSNTTRNQHFDTISTFFKWAVSRGFTDKNYAEGLRISREKKKKVRDVFTKEDLQKIISGAEYMRVKGKKHKKDAFFWAPIIGIFTGARLNEICQLKPVDVREDDGIWYFAFCSEGDAVAKTEAAIRNVPIHNMLIEIGFLNFVKRQKKQNHQRLFPDLIKHTKNGYGAQVSKWFNRYLVKVGVKDGDNDANKKVFHSFRHTVIHHLQQKGVEEKRIKVMVGHTSDDLSYYQHEQGLKILANEVIAKIDFGLDFSHLMDKKRNEYLG